MKKGFLIGLSLLLIGCPWHPDPPISVDPPPPPYQVAVRLAFSFPNPSDPSAINSIRVDVQGANATAMTQSFVRGTGFTAKTDPIIITMPVPMFYGSSDNNFHRIFTARAFAASDGTGTPLFQGSTTSIQASFLEGYKKPRITIALSPPPSAAPTITSFDPNTECGGAALTLTGTNFDPIIQNNTVNFIGANSSSDDRLAVITEATSTQLTVAVPRDAVNGPIEVSNVLGRVTSANSFPRSTTPCFGLPQTIHKDTQAVPIDNLQVAVSGSTIIVTWSGYNTYSYASGQEGVLPPRSGIFVTRSTDGGATFSPPVNIPGDLVFYSHQVVFSGTTVIVGWTGYNSSDNRRQGASDVFIARSTDSGVTFDAPVNISNDRGDSGELQLALSGSTVIAAWLNAPPGQTYYIPGDTGRRSILVARSSDGGATFTTPISLSTSNNIPGDFDLVLSGTTVLAAWIGYPTSNTSQADIFMTRSADAGTTFSPPMNISNKLGLLNHPHISLSGTTTIMIWEEITLANRGSIMMARSTDAGVTFSPPVNLSESQNDAYFPQLIFSDATALVAWIGRSSFPSPSLTGRADGDIFVARSTDNGATFGAPVKISNRPGYPYDLQWAISHTLVMAVWSDTTLGNEDIFAAYSSNGGATFSRPVNVSNNQGTAFNPSVVLTGTTGVVLWGDYAPYPGGGLWASRFQ